MQLTQDTIYELAPFARTLGVEFPHLDPDQVRAELATDPSLSTTGGGLHGGAIMSLCDLAGAVCVGLNLPEGTGWTTAESTTTFLRGVHGARATAVAAPVKLGRSLINVEIDLYDDTERHCARTSQVLLVQSHSG